MGITALLGMHVVTCLIIPALAPRRMRTVFVLAAIPPASTLAWALWLLLGGDAATVPTATVDWVPGLDLSFTFAVDALAALMTVLVCGIGALVFVYCVGYFDTKTQRLGRFAATLLAFATAMLGLVWADNVWTLFIFWELTSVTSFLLVGHKDADPIARAAARRALLLTVGGGLALLAGLVVLVDDVGTARLNELGPASGTLGTVAAILVLVAAATKSAQVPFHMWLPGAMAAPTPVSAYLHSATMVKAGVLLIAITAPALATTNVWTPVGVTIGLTSMIWGAVGALRHRDAKLILAWGTVSQLGLMIALLALDVPKATFAATALLLAHAVFKAALFMVVGEIDVRTGTRDITELAGLWRAMPLAFGVAAISAASMAGIPLVLGFPAKEAAIEAVIGLSGPPLLIVAPIVIGGSVLTVAYTVRLLIGLFGSGPVSTPVQPLRAALTAPSAALAAISIIGYGAAPAVTRIVRAAASEITPGSEVYVLLRWPGLTVALGVSLGVVVAGVLLGIALARHSRTPVPRPLAADFVDRSIDAVVLRARQLGATVQHGSLPVYLVTMAICAILASIPFATEVQLDALYRWDNPLQPVFGAAVVAASVAAAAMTGSRLGAALSLGVVGVGMAGLFVVHGAPDLALTQLLVETVIVVAFVIGLGYLTRQFPPAGQIWQRARIVTSLLVGAAVAVALAASASAPSGAPAIQAMSQQAATAGGGNNVVNVILTDLRALDTLGEVVVLIVVAVGILSLAGNNRRGEQA